MLRKTLTALAVAVLGISTPSVLAQQGYAPGGHAPGVYQFNSQMPPMMSSAGNNCAPSGGCSSGVGCGESGLFTPNSCGGFGSGGGGGCNANGGGLLGGAAGNGGLASLFDNECANGIDFGGWVQAGYHSAGSLVPRFNTHPDRLNLHQGWLYAEKVADGSNGVGFGFRVDAMYGVDAQDTQAFGNNPGNWDYLNGFDHGSYGFALPQAYIEMAAGDWSVKAGHFFTLIGYEVVTAPDNFFYSHAFTMYNSEPFTHTGVLATYNASDSMTLYGGWTAGWDTGFDQFGNGSSFLGGASLSLTDTSTLTYITTIGDFGARGSGYSHSIVLDNQINDNLNYIIQSDYLDTDSATGPLGQPGDEQYGVNQYLIRKINETVSAGVRFEWWRTNGLSFYDATFGLNIKPMDDIVIRPEIRRDWSPGADYEETIFGVDAILSF